MITKEKLNERKSMYDLIANHYWEMDKEELKTIALETIYALESFLSQEKIEEAEDEAVTEIIERLYLDEE